MTSSPLDIVKLFKKSNPNLYTLMNNISHDYDLDSQHEHHSEGSIWAHTISVLTTLLGFSYPSIPSIELMLATLMHDVGKCHTLVSENASTDDSKPIAKNLFYGHESFSSIMVYDILKNMGLLLESVNIRRVIELVNMHMIFSYNFGEITNDVFKIKAKELELIDRMFCGDLDLFRELLELIKADGFGRITRSNKYSISMQRYTVLMSYLNSAIQDKHKKDPSTCSRTVIILIGLPGSGKSMYRNEFLKEHTDFKLASLDSLIEREMKTNRCTYSDIFYKNKSLLNNLNKEYNSQIQELIHDNSNILCDATNLSVKSRSKKLSSLNKESYKKAIVFIRSLEDIYKINESRKECKGKYLPRKTIDTMCKTFEVPTYNEFDEIEYRFI